MSDCRQGDDSRQDKRSKTIIKGGVKKSQQPSIFNMDRQFVTIQAQSPQHFAIIVLLLFVSPW
jgi:hypothetical protein